METEKSGLGTYTNPFYQPTSETLVPLVSSKTFGVWKDLYLKFNPAYRPPESVAKRARQMMKQQPAVNGSTCENGNEKS